MKEITPYVKVRVFYGPQLTYDKEQMKSSIYEKLIENNIDTSKVSLFYNDRSYGAIQDPGAIFLRNGKGQLAILDFKIIHPDKRAEEIDRNVAAKLYLPTIPQKLFLKEAGGKLTAREHYYLLNQLNWTETNQ